MPYVISRICTPVLGINIFKSDLLSCLTTELLSWILFFPYIPEGQHIRQNDKVGCRKVLVMFSIMSRLRLPIPCHLLGQPCLSRVYFQLTILQID